jgi:hypothetical protein
MTSITSHIGVKGRMENAKILADKIYILSSLNTNP